MFSMDLGSGETCGHVVVALHGELDLVDAPAVANALRVLAKLKPRIIVDLAGLEFIDASGVAALSRGRRHARHAGGDLLLAAPRGLVRRVLAIVWEVDGGAVPASVAEAVASAGASRHPVVPIQRQPAKLRWQCVAMNAPIPKRHAVTDDGHPRGSSAPRRQSPTVGGD